MRFYAWKLKYIQSQTIPKTRTSTDDDSSEKELEVFILDPYYANINPRTSASRALFNNVTKDFETNKHLNATIENAKKVLAHLEDLATKFGWGELVNLVEDNDGKRRSILRESKLLTIENAQNQALTYLTDDDITDILDNKIMCDLDPENDEYDKIKFYARVQSKIISKAIKGHFRSNTLTTLRN